MSAQLYIKFIIQIYLSIMFQKNKDQKNMDFDERSNPLMTLKTVKYLCEKEGLFSTPEHNDKLYLQYKGFIKIVPETLAQYTNLVALWLNNNGLSKIEGLDHLINLKSLALNNNFIQKIQGLQNLHNLSILNLSHNKIEIVEGLESQRILESLNLSQNFIISSKGLTGLKYCQNLTSLDLSQNQIENSEESFQEIIQNHNISCLYLKATPFARGFRNYRKRFIASFNKLKFLDDRPVNQQDHRLAQAWNEGGAEQEKAQRQKIAEQKLKLMNEQKQLRVSSQQDASKKPKVEGFIASIKDESIKIMNVDSKEEERIINQYYQREKQQIQKNIQKRRQQQEKMKQINQYYQNHQTEVITEKVNEILGLSQDKQQFQEQNKKQQQKTQAKWNNKYQKILETLLLRYKFDFSQVQPSFNMIIANINKKIMKASIRFEINELRKIWTQVQLRKRSERNST